MVTRVLGLGLFIVEGARSEACAVLIKAEALVGFQGRGFADGVPPDFGNSLFLEALIFQ
jgi:hypothetical protein